MTQQRNGKGERFGVVGILSPLFLIWPQVSGQSLSPVLMHFPTIEMKMHALIYRLPTRRKPQTCKMSPAKNVIYAQSLGKCRSTDKGADCQSVGPIGLPSTEPMPRVFNFIVQFFWLLKPSALFNQFLLDLQFQVDDISPAGTEGAVSLGLSVRSAEGSAPEGSS
ncbi:GM22171 [Drosophila sechellia]|uniref:GM22171 n=1 Tax=Drosophila sechellia TaxID=7238 RepID=B4IAI6_DROSE|nr:GM22171 [Drosophila sechellia]